MSSKEACERKVRYTHRQARAEVRLRGKGGKAYFCEHCSGWHVTSIDNFVSENTWRLISRERRRKSAA